MVILHMEGIGLGAGGFEKHAESCNVVYLQKYYSIRIFLNEAKHRTTSGKSMTRKISLLKT
jgi:hypothetical protein